MTEAADELFPEDYRGLTDYLLDEVSQKLGKDGLGELLNNIAGRLAGEAPPLHKNQSFEERLDEVVTFLGEKGFAVCWEANDNGYMIHTHSCPYRRVAKDHSEICLLDKHVIGTMLNTTPSRIACLTSGDDRCTYQVRAPIELVMDPV